MTSDIPDGASRPAPDAAHLTVLTHQGFIGKRFELGADGLQKTSKATFHAGTAQVLPAPDAAELARILDGLQPRDVLALGVIKGGKTSARVLTNDTHSPARGEIARSLAYFEHRKAQGWILLDHDTKDMPEDVKARIAELGGGVAAIESIWPELAQAERVFRPSSSGGVYIEGGSPSEATGFHLFTLLEDVSQSQAVLDVLMARAWEAGLAWHAVSKNGSLLERGIIDAAVGGPERLVFTAPPALGVGVLRRAPETRIQRGVALAAPSMPEGDAWRRRKLESRRRIKPEAEAAEAAFIDTQADKIAKQTGKPKAAAKLLALARIQGGILKDDDILELRDGTSARVGDILNMHFPKAGAAKFALPDPIEGLAYGATTAAIIWDEPYPAPVLISHAHGQHAIYHFARYMTPEDEAAKVALRAQRRATETGDMPEATELPDGKRKTLEAALRGADSRDTAMGAALAVIAKRIRQTPHAMTEADLIDFILANLPENILSADDIDALRKRVDTINSLRKRAALGFADLSATGLRRLWRGHDVMVVQRLEDVALLPKGVALVKAPMGSGKTQVIGRPWVDAARKRGSVMAICHRVSLVDELAARLDLPHYLTAAPDDVILANGMAVCLPSITSKLAAGAMPQPDFVFIDEVAQVLRFLESKETCRTSAADAEGVFEALVDIIRNAKAVLVADAGLDDRVVDFLRHCRPKEQFRVIQMPATAQNKTARIYGSADPSGETVKARVMDDVILELAAGGKAWIACESAKLVQDVATVLEGQGHKVLAVTAATKENPAQKAFLRSADAVSRQYDAVIVSPAVVSGISIQHDDAAHFTLGAFLGAGHAIVPADAAQQIARVRYLRRYAIGLGGNNRSGGQESEAILRGLEALADIENAPTRMSRFDAMRADIEAKTANAQADFAAGLFWMLEADGWALDVVHADDSAEIRARMKEAKATRVDAWQAAIMAAEIPDPDSAALMRSKRSKTPEEAAAVEAYDIAMALGVGTIGPDELQIWDDGHIAGRLRRFEDLARIGELPEISDNRIIARDFRHARRALYSELFAGVDLKAETPFTPEMQDIFIDRVMARREALVAARILPERYRATYRGKGGKPNTMPRPKQFRRVLDDVLNRVGLRIVEKRKRVARNSGSLYKDIQLEGVSGQQEKQRFYGICPASWAMMTGIIERRDAAPVPWDDIDSAAPPITIGPDSLQQPDIEIPHPAPPDGMDFIFAGGMRRARQTAEARAKVGPDIIAPQSAVAKVAMAIDAGHKTHGAIASETRLGVTKTYRTIARMQEAGMVHEARHGGLYLAQDLAAYGLHRAQVPDAKRSDIC